jgi:thiol-disulfide isomerase/thioredoxin
MTNFIIRQAIFRSFVGLVSLVTSALPGLAAAPGKAPAASSQSTAEDLPGPLLYLTIMLSRDRTIQSELRLSRSQTEAIEGAVAEVELPLWQLRDVSPQDAADRVLALRAQFQQKLVANLTAVQLLRLNQLVLQARGSKAFSSQEIAQRLSLTSENRRRLQDVAQQLEKEIEQSDKKNADKSAAEQSRLRTKLWTAGHKKILDLLTDEQQSDLAKLLGKPFDLSHVRQAACLAPEIRDVESWLNTEPLTLKELRGKVVVVHFWAFGCINCVRNLPHYQAWHEKFPPKELTIIGIQTPETESERSIDNLRRKVDEYRIAYPVAFDAASENWKAWANNMWPSVYLIDKQGHVRNWWYGELNWQGARGEEFLRNKIEELLAEK